MSMTSQMKMSSVSRDVMFSPESRWYEVLFAIRLNNSNSANRSAFNHIFSLDMSMGDYYSDEVVGECF